MRKVILNMKESKKYEVIKQLVDKGESSAAKNRAAVKLSCSRRTIDRLIALYKSEGKEGFIHRNRNRPPATRFDDETRRKIIDLYANDYPDANISHFKEIVEEEMNINISDETIRLWLIEEKIVSPKSHRITRKRIKKRCKEELKKARSQFERVYPTTRG
ncbi:MAG: helix-turn-helix domain-containing protein, partial [Oscillospiraceae bacterium]|nr:helix-turn-helix domain-containing protein [Oscillospiraceae bacterium]